MKEKITNSLGAAGMVLYYAILIFVSVLPIVMIDMPFWADLIFLGIMMFLPVTSGVFWIWGLIATIRGPQDAFAIIYYVLFVIMFVPVFISIITGLVKK